MRQKYGKIDIDLFFVFWEQFGLPVSGSGDRIEYGSDPKTNSDFHTAKLHKRSLNAHAGMQGIILASRGTYCVLYMYIVHINYGETLFTYPSLPTFKNRFLVLVNSGMFSSLF
jgi:hypothetical protein